jgi:hypothetical protein
MKDMEKQIAMLAMLQLKRLVAGFPRRLPGFDPRSGV